MRRRILTALAGVAVAVGLAACAPAVPGVPGSIRVVSPIPDPASAPSGEPLLAIDGAFAIGSGPIVIDAWVDFFCPFCRMFEEANGDFIGALVRDDVATLRVHPIAILDRASMGTKYSTRSANAFACVAEFSPDDALDYMASLYANQPQESTEGLSDDELAVGAPRAAVDCIHDGRFGGWVTDWTQQSLDAGVQGTPTVFVNGSRYTGSLNGPEFRNFVAAVTTAV